MSTPLAVDYSLNARQEYVDNYGFRGPSSFITSIGPAATFRLDGETLRLSGNVGLFATHFSNPQAGRSQTTDPRFRFDGTYLRERSTFGLSSTYLRDRQFGSATVPQPGGFQLSDATRTLFSIAPTYSYAITERLSLNASYGYSTITLDRAGPGLVDTRSDTVGGGMQYRLTEVDGIGFSVTQTAYTTTPTTTDSDTRGVQFSWNRRWTERTSTSVFAGATKSDIRSKSTQTVCLLPLFFCQTGQFPFQTLVNNQSYSATTPTYGFTATTQVGPRTTVIGQGSRGIQPGGAGALLERSTLSVEVNHQFMERFAGSVDYLWTEASLVGQGFSSGANTVQVVSANLTYRFPDNWSLVGGTRFSQTDLAGAQPVSKAIFVSISKTWPNRRLWP